MIKFPINRPYTRIEALVDYFCNIKRSPQIFTRHELSYRWNWPRTTVTDFLKYVNSVAFAQENPILFDYLVKPHKNIMTPRKPVTESPTQKETQPEQLLFEPLLTSNDIKHPFSPAFTTLFIEWIGHLQQKHSKKYKSLAAMQKALTKLVNLSKNREDMASDVIRSSMKNNWDTLRADFEIRDKYKINGRKRKSKEAPLIPESPDVVWEK
jgi:hypothetical protein